MDSEGPTHGVSEVPLPAWNKDLPAVAPLALHSGPEVAMRNQFDLRAYPTPQGDAVRVRGSLSLPCDNDPKADRVNTIQFEICLQDDPDALEVDPKDPSAVGPVIRGRLKGPLQELLNAATENRQLATE